MFKIQIIDFKVRRLKLQLEDFGYLLTHGADAIREIGFISFEPHRPTVGQKS